jgi:SPP1 family predicted phage head-tail adaptor
MNLNGKISNPGEMRTQVTLQKRTVPSAPGGFQAPVWVDLATVYAKWANVHGSEVWAAASINAIQPATVLIRYRSGIDTTCQLVKGGIAYEIISIDNIQERNEYLELKVQRQAAG